MGQGTGQLPPQSLLNERYLILKVVGRGGMGCVYRASDTLMGNRMVAIKEMSQRHWTPESLPVAEQRFAQEAAILQKLTLTPHSHLPTFYEAFSQGIGNQRRSYLVMDFIEGETLEKILNEASNKCLALATMFHYASQLCDVLSYLHQQSPPVIFRDLKPSNIIISPGDVVYVIDFGIARHFKPGQSGDTDRFISNGYSAPENFGNEQTDPRSDLFSLGATLHRCLTGEDPGKKFPGNFNFSPICACNPQVPQTLEALIMQMVAIKPEHRPASAKEVYSALFQVMRLGASPTVPVQPTRIDWSSFKALRLFVIMASWVLSVSRKVGQQAIDLVKSLLSRWKDFRESQRDKRRAQSSSPPQPSPIVDRARKVFEQVAQAQLRLPLAGSSADPPHLLPLFAVLFFALISSLYMVVRQHISPWLVLFLFGLCLLCLAFFAATRHALDRITQAILAVTMLAILLVCIILLFQPDVATFIRSITTAQVIAAGLALLGIASLLRPFEYYIWLDHTVVSIGVGLCAFLQLVLGPQELAWLPSPWNTSVGLFVSLVLGAGAFIQLFRLKLLYSSWDYLTVILAAICSMGQLIAFGNQALQPFAPDTPWSALTLNIILSIAIVLLAILSYYFDSGAWVVIARLSLLVFMLVSAAMLLFVSTHLTGFALAPSFNFLSDNYFDPTHLNQFLINSLVGAASIIALVLIRKSAFLLVDLLLVITVASPPLLLQNAFSPDVVPSYLLTFKRIVVPLVSWSILLSLLLVVISAMFLFFPESDLSHKVAMRVDRAILFLGHMLLWTSAGMCLIFLWEFGYNEGITTGVFSQISTQLLWFAPLGAAFIIAAWKMLLAGHRLLYSLSHAVEKEQEERDPWDADERTEIKILTFTPWDRVVMFTVAGYLALLVSAMPERFPAIATDLPGIAPPGSFALCLVLAGLFIAVPGLLGWLRRPSIQDQNGYRMYITILLTASGCLLMASGSLAFALMRPLFIYTSLIAIILLMLGLLLAIWEQGGAHQISS